MIPSDTEAKAYEVLFLFSAPPGWLAEIRRLDLPSGTPKHQIYHWLWLGADGITALRFLSMATAPRQQRSFEQADLWFDDKAGELRWHSGEPVALSVPVDRGLPAALHRQVLAYFGI